MYDKDKGWINPFYKTPSSIEELNNKEKLNFEYTSAIMSLKRSVHITEVPDIHFYVINGTNKELTMRKCPHCSCIHKGLTIFSTYFTRIIITPIVIFYFLINMVNYRIVYFRDFWFFRTKWYNAQFSKRGQIQSK